MGKIRMSGIIHGHSENDLLFLETKIKEMRNTVFFNFDFCLDLIYDFDFMFNVSEELIFN